MLSCSVVSSLDAVVIVSPFFVVSVMLFSRLLVGDGSPVSGRSIVPCADVFACFAVLPSAMVSSCCLFSVAAVGSACLPWCDVGDVAMGRSVIGCLVTGMLGPGCVAVGGASSVSSTSMVCVPVSVPDACVVPGVLGRGMKLGAATVRLVGFQG